MQQERRGLSVVRRWLKSSCLVTAGARLTFLRGSWLRTSPSSPINLFNRYRGLAFHPTTARPTATTYAPNSVFRLPVTSSRYRRVFTCIHCCIIGQAGPSFTSLAIHLLTLAQSVALFIVGVCRSTRNYLYSHLVVLLQCNHNSIAGAEYATS